MEGNHIFFGRPSVFLVYFRNFSSFDRRTSNLATFRWHTLLAQLSGGQLTTAAPWVVEGCLETLEINIKNWRLLQRGVICHYLQRTWLLPFTRAIRVLSSPSAVSANALCSRYCRQRFKASSTIYAACPFCLRTIFGTFHFFSFFIYFCSSRSQVLACPTTCFFLSFSLVLLVSNSVVYTSVLTGS